MFSWPRSSKSTDLRLPFRFRPCLEVLEERNLLDVSSLAPMPAPWVQVFHGDFNGDGKQDVAGIDSSGQWWVSLSTGTSFTPRTKWAQWSVPGSWSKLFVADVNGDGKDDIVGFGYNGTWFVGMSNGTDQFVTGAAWAHWSDPSSWSQLFVGDFNGDHKADIAGLGNNGAWFVGLSNGTDTFATGKPWAQWSIGVSWSYVVIGDFNGDGKKDVAGLGFNGTWFVGLSNGTDTFTTGAAWAQWSIGASWSQVFVGDFNGDKKDDVAGFGINQDWTVGLSTGTNQFSTQPWASWYTYTSAFTHVRTNSQGWTQLFVADVDGDGKADIVGFNYDPPYFVPPSIYDPGRYTDPWGIWHTTLSQGAQYDGLLDTFWSVPNSWSALMVADFTGGGGADIAGFSPINNAWSVAKSNSPSIPAQAQWSPVHKIYTSDPWQWVQW